MGGYCSSGGNKDVEVDMFLKKHHQYNTITTDKNCYEISKQYWDPKQACLISKKEEDQFQINDEIEQRQHERQLAGEYDEDILKLSMNLANKTIGSSAIYNSGVRMPQNLHKLKTTNVKQTYSLALEGEQGTGGKPFVKKVANPYLEVDMSDPDDPILFQGELQKFKPGFNGMFIDRWVQVTKKAIRYFASKPGSHIAAGKPLMAVPIIAVKSIERINQDLKVKKTDKKGHELQKHVFEIFMKEDFLDIFLRSDYEQLFGHDSKRRNHLLMVIQKENRLNPSPSKKNVKELFIADEENRAEEPLKQAAMQSLNTHGGAWSNRSGMWPLSERRFVFSSKKEIVTTQWMENLLKVVHEVNGVDDSKIAMDILDSPNGTIENISVNSDDSILAGGPL